jgi:hypothetical protein
MAFASLYPCYELKHFAAVKKIDKLQHDTYRCAPPIMRAGCTMLFAANRARTKIQLLASCHALLGSEHCNRAPLRKK